MLDIEDRLASLEEQVLALRSEFKKDMHDTAHELRDSDTFMGPFSSRLADKAGDHLLTKLGRQLLFWTAGAVITAFLLWLGGTGVLFK